jgi:hypothetical protein
VIKPVSVVTGVVILVAIMVLLFHLSTDYSDYSMHNPGWNGTSQLFGDLPAERAVLLSTNAGLSQYNDSVLLIIAPGKNFSQEDLTSYLNFLDRGNTIVLFDDFGTGNELLRQTGTGIQIRQIPLLSADRAFEDPVFLKTYPVNDGELVLNISGLTMDRPSALYGGDPFLVTSLLSWEDTNHNNKADQNETIGQFVVGSSGHVGKGRIIVISDPGILINSMTNTGTGQDRDRFIDIILHLNRTALIDQTNSMTANTTPQSRIIHVVQTTSSIRIGILTLILLIVFFGFQRRIW